MGFSADSVSAKAPRDGAAHAVVHRKPEMGMDVVAMQKKRSALVADDDEFFRAAMTAILTSRIGFLRVIEARSFDEAADLLGSPPGDQEIGLAVFDLSMPGISNPTNLRSIRETVPGLPILVASASERRSDIISSLDAGVHGYVPKRLGIEELERAVRRVLAGDVYVPILLTDVWRTDDEALPSPGAGDREESRKSSPRPPDLTPRQREVLELIVQGKSNKEIARTLGLGEGTVRVHMTALFRNLEVVNRTAAAAVGSSLGLTLGAAANS